MRVESRGLHIIRNLAIVDSSLAFFHIKAGHIVRVFALSTDYISMRIMLASSTMINLVASGTVKILLIPDVTFIAFKAPIHVVLDEIRIKSICDIAVFNMLHTFFSIVCGNHFIFAFKTNIGLFLWCLSANCASFNDLSTFFTFSDLFVVVPKIIFFAFWTHESRSFIEVDFIILRI